jgi:hypothetical protein
VWFGIDGSFEILILREYGSGIINARPSDGNLKRFDHHRTIGV